MIRGTGKAHRHARTARDNLTLPEIILWQYLRGGKSGLKWRKQHAAGKYSLDFYCDRAKLCVEVDGEAHSRGNQPARDAERDAVLALHGIETLRVRAVDVLRNLEGVLRSIANTANARKPLHHRPAAGGPPPRDELGEELKETR